MKVLWSFEPAGLKSAEISHLHSLILKFAKSDSNIVLSHIEGEVYAGAADPYGLTAIYMNQRKPEQEVEASLKAAKVNLKPVQKVFSSIPVSSVSGAIRKTLQVGQKKGVDAIALFTQSKKGLERFLAGSFAETMVHLSQKDLILLSPHAEKAPEKGPVIFMDDFSAESKKAVEKAMDLAKSVGSDLIVYHVPHFAYSSPINGENKWVVRYRKMVDQRVAQIEKLGQSKKVKVTVVLGTSKTPIIDSVLKLAKEQSASLIVVAAKIGRLGSLLGGSVTRQLVRRSPLPTYIFKSKTNSFKKKGKS